MPGQPASRKRETPLGGSVSYHPPPPPPPPPPPEDPPPPLPELEPGAVEADEMALLNELVNEEATARGRTRPVAEVPESRS